VLVLVDGKIPLSLFLLFESQSNMDGERNSHTHASTYKIISHVHAIEREFFILMQVLAKFVVHCIKAGSIKSCMNVLGGDFSITIVII
jgi:hypothetical protein